MRKVISIFLAIIMIFSLITVAIILPNTNIAKDKIISQITDNLQKSDISLNAIAIKIISIYNLQIQTNKKINRINTYLATIYTKNIQNIYNHTISNNNIFLTLLLIIISLIIVKMRKTVLNVKMVTYKIINYPLKMNN